MSSEPTSSEPTSSGPAETVMVLLAPASGLPVDAAWTTAERVADIAPDADGADAVAAYFRDQGCQVGPLVGISFSVTIPADRVQRLLGDEVDGQFPHPSIPAALARPITAIVRERPIDFGPVSFR